MATILKKYNVLTTGSPKRPVASITELPKYRPIWVPALPMKPIGSSFSSPNSQVKCGRRLPRCARKSRPPPMLLSGKWLRSSAWWQQSSRFSICSLRSSIRCSATESECGARTQISVGSQRKTVTSKHSVSVTAHPQFGCMRLRGGSPGFRPSGRLLPGLDSASGRAQLPGAAHGSWTGPGG